MKTKLTYFGHACFMLTNGDVSMIFDPFLTGNTWDIAKKEDIKCQYIFVSHGHDDHYGDTEFIAKANDALVISTAEVAGKAAAADCRTHAMHLGGKYDFIWFRSYRSCIPWRWRTRWSRSRLHRQLLWRHRILCRRHRPL